jgi:hypothetical protein
LKAISRAKYIFLTEGLIPLVRQGFSFITRFFYQDNYYYIIEHSPRRLEEKDFLPSLRNYRFELVESEGSRSGSAGYVYLTEKVVDAREKLEAGAVAFCVFHENDLASIGWVALDEKAQGSLFQPPYRVDFAAGEASTGGGWTNPSYRGKGLAAYIYFKRLEYIWGKGIKSVKAAVITGNLASLKMHSRFSPVVKSMGRDLKILNHRSWNEVLVNKDLRDLTK